jgi:DNA polymerase I-like protein with 3'-5' exonuclease and polymerase domains
MRLSCVNPNLQNVVADKEGADTLAAGFRACVVASPSCKLVALDFAAIEAVQTGWFIGDPDFIKLAALGIHAYCASHDLGRPASISWSHDQLDHYFKELKAREPAAYKRNKQGVYLTLYGGSAHMLHALYPQSFPTLNAAQKWQAFFFALCPRVSKWQDELRKRASKQGFLGGADHPFGYRHWFWNVYDYNSRTQRWHLGDDAKRCVAFYPQSTAFGVLAEASLRLLDPTSPSYVGELYYGRTPIRALIHDEILAEVPDQHIDDYVEKACREMRRPVVQQPCPPEWGLGPHLAFGVSVKIGQDWAHMQEIEPAAGVAADTAVRLEEVEVDA